MDPNLKNENEQNGNQELENPEVIDPNSQETDEHEEDLEGVDPVKKTGIQKRIDKLVAKRDEAEREAAYWRGKAESVITPKTPVTPEPEVESELDPNDFNSDADYLKAVAKRIEEKIERKSRVQNELAEKREKSQILLSSAKKARLKYPDFDTVAFNKNVVVTETMFDTALGENVGDILYHLGKNPAEASRIASLPPLQQAKEIGRIETMLKIPVKKVTSAPPPTPDLKSGGKPAEKSASELTRKELHAQWDADRRKKLGIK